MNRGSGIPARRITVIFATAIVLSFSCLIWFTFGPGPFTAQPTTTRPQLSPPVPAHSQPAVAGVTVDDTTHLGAIVDSLRHLPRRATVRLVLDIDRRHPTATSDWVDAISQLSRVATVMGELDDSDEMKAISTAQMTARARAYVRAFGSKVAVWEIGNEVNGDWTGNRSVVAAKTIAAYNAVHAAGGRTALTLYENAGCGDGPQELSPTAWARAELPASVRAGLDEVLLSYYEDECNQIRPTTSQWTARFAALRPLFPHAKLGFGEIGLTDAVSKHTMSAAQSLINHYYTLNVAVPNWIGGYFWWYFAEDMVPRTDNPLFTTLAVALRRGYG